MKKSLNKYDLINISIIIISLIGLIVELIGSLILSYTTKIGFNFHNLHPLLFVGFGISVVSFVLSIFGNRLIYKHSLNDVIASISLYLGLIIFLAGPIIIALTITGPVLWPVNG